MKNAIRALLIVAFALVFIGCSQETEQIIPEYSTAIDLDFYGYEFVYLLNDSEDDNIFLTYEENTVFGDAALKRIRDGERELNFVYKPRYGNSITEMMQYAIVAGDTDISAMQWSRYDDSLQSTIRAGYLYPINELEQINYLDEEKWGRKYMREGLCWNNSLYGLIPSEWPEFSLCSTDFIFAVNTDYVRSLAMDDPREYYETGVWTRKKLEETVQAYTHDRTDGTRIYGLTTNGYHFMVSAINAGVDDLVVKKDGAYKFAAYTDDGRDAVAWGADFLHNTCVDYILPDTTGTEEIIQAFVDKRAVMINMCSAYIFRKSLFNYMESIAYCGIPYAIMPFPRSDNSDYGTWKSLFEMVYHCVTISAITEEPEATAYILNYIYEPLDGYETKDDIKDYYLKYVFHDERDYDLFFKLLETDRYVFRGEGMYDFYAGLENRTKTTSVSAALEALENTADTIINEYVINIRNSFNTIFGE